MFGFYGKNEMKLEKIKPLSEEPWKNKMDKKEKRGRKKCLKTYLRKCRGK